MTAGHMQSGTGTVPDLTGVTAVAPKNTTAALVPMRRLSHEGPGGIILFGVLSLLSCGRSEEAPRITGTSSIMDAASAPAPDCLNGFRRQCPDCPEGDLCVGLTDAGRAVYCIDHGLLH